LAASEATGQKREKGGRGKEIVDPRSVLVGKRVEVIGKANTSESQQPAYFK